MEMVHLAQKMDRRVTETLARKDWMTHEVLLIDRSRRVFLKTKVIQVTKNRVRKCQPSNANNKQALFIKP